MMTKKYLPHILLPNKPEQKKYINPIPGRGKIDLKKRDRKIHGEFLLSKLSQAWKLSEKELAVYKTSRKGIYLEFKGESKFDLPLMSLESMRSKNPDLNIRISITFVVPGSNCDICFFRQALIFSFAMDFSRIALTT